jgi:carboxypeptidase C (cathepsin A)
MLGAGVRVMIYAGDKDIICNYLGNRRWVDAMQWERAGEWAQAADVEWSVDGVVAGQVAEVGPLSFVRVHDAG